MQVLKKRERDREKVKHEFSFNSQVTIRRHFLYKSKVRQDESFSRGTIINILKGFSNKIMIPQ